MEKEKKNNFNYNGDSSNKKNGEKKNVSWNKNSSLDVLKKVQGNPLKAQSGTNAFGQSKRQAYFLMEQLKGAKAELTAFRENHRQLLNQLFKVKKDFKDTVENLKKEKSSDSKEYKKLEMSFKLKDKEFTVASKKFETLKDDYKKIQFLYVDKISKFKEQFKEKIKEQEKKNITETAELKVEKSQAEKRVRKLTASLAKKNDEINSLKSDQAKLMKENNSLVDNEKSKHDQVGKIKFRLDEYKRGCSNLSLKLNAKSEEVKNLTTRIEALEVERKNYTQNIESHLSENLALKVSINKKNEMIQRIELDQKSYDKLKIEQQSFLEEINSYKMKEKSFRDEVGALEADLESGKREREKLSKEIVRINEQVEASEKEKERLKVSFEVAKTKIGERLEFLGSQNDELEREKELLAENLDELKRELAGERESHEKERAFSKDASGKIESVLQEKRDLKINLEQLKGEIKVLSDKVVQAQIETADVKTEVSSKSHEITGYKKRITSFQNLKERMQSEQVSLEMQIIELSNEIKDLRVRNSSSMDQESLLLTTVDSLETDIKKLKSEKDGYENRISELNTAIEMEKLATVDLKSDLSQNIDELAQHKVREANFLKKESELKEEVESLEEKLKTLESDLVTKEDQLRDKQNTCDDYFQQQEVLNEEISKLNNKIEELSLKNKSLDEDKDFEVQKNKDLILEKSSFKSQLEEKNVKAIELNEKIALLTQREARIQSEVEALRKEIQETVKFRDEDKGDYKAQIKQLEDERRALEKQNSAEKEENLKLEIKAQELSLEIKRMEATLGAELDKSKVGSKKFNDLEEEEKRLLNKLEKKDRRVSDLSSELERRRSEVSILNDKLRESQNVSRTMERKNKELELRVETRKTLDKNLAAFNKEKKSLDAQAEERNRKLSYYSRWVDSQKESLQKHVVRFAQELKSAEMIHPLKSYLILTEKEITKAQRALSKQKVFGPQRAQMEQHYDRLVQQKGYVEDMITKSQRDTERRVEEVLGLLKQGEFVPVPPVPPVPPEFKAEKKELSGKKGK